MSFYHRSGEKRKSVEEFVYKDEETMDTMDSGEGSPKHGDSEKRMRREIANSNERRRMQIINTGFNSLKMLIPCHDGEKLSKGAILQQTSEYISNLESEKTRLLSQNNILRQALKELNKDPDALVGPIQDQITPPPKRKKRDTESSDEGISLGFDHDHIDELKKEVVELRLQLERERKMRRVIEERHNRLEAQGEYQGSDKLRAIVTDTQITSLKDEKVVRIEHKPASTTASSASTAEIKPEPVTPTTRLPMPQHSVTERSAQPMKVDIPGGGAHGPLYSHHQHGGPRYPVFASSMSKRNLETIVEAIRHLEGDHVLTDNWKECGAPINAAKRRCPPSSNQSHIPPQSEESQPESSGSDCEEVDLKSDSSSGRDSPTPPPPSRHHPVAPQQAPAAVATVITVAASVSSPPQLCHHQAATVTTSSSSSSSSSSPLNNHPSELQHQHSAAEVSSRNAAAATLAQVSCSTSGSSGYVRVTAAPIPEWPLMQPAQAAAVVMTRPGVIVQQAPALTRSS